MQTFGRDILDFAYWSLKCCMSVSLNAKLCKRVCTPPHPLVLANKAFPLSQVQSLEGDEVCCQHTGNAKLACRRQRAEWVSQRICNATPTLILLRPANGGAEVRVSHSVKTCSPLIVLSLHPNVHVKHIGTHLRRRKWQMDMKAGSELAPFYLSYHAETF